MAAKPTSGERRLVIVESPAKAKTIAGYLGPEYEVEASVGHIRDLAVRASELPEDLRKQPWAKLAVDVDHDYEPYYVVHATKRAKVAELRKKLASATELLLATDEDREGEAISWHLQEVLKPKVPVRRMVFNEITRDAIRSAAENTRDLDMRLVDAQETRRIVDRLYGYQVSEVLWRKIGSSARSAGRVQSVAVRLVVDRERERIAFRSASYADIRGEFDPGKFSAALAAVDGVRIAGGKDFDQTGTLTASNVLHLDEAAATALADALAGVPFVVRSVQEKPGTRKPSAPFMTSTLQQEASRRFGWNARRTMQVAQRLYENGFITYMRTDSTTLSATALAAARAQAAEMFGADHVSDTPRRFDRKVKNAQEAHEAIRPSGDSFRTPGEVAGSLDSEEFRLYDLIWKRTLASQMADARISTTTLRLGATAADGRDAEFSASGTVVKFAGFRAAYEETSDDDSAADGEGGRLPALAEGDAVEALSLVPDPHATRPPARYTEASLVSALEDLGIGRPSTYAAIMSTIVDRGYVWKKGSALVPSWTAFAVNRLLEEHFTALVDYTFTARMEEVLDAVSNGETSRLASLEGFYRGSHGAIEFPGLVALLDESGEIDAREISAFPVEGTDAILRVGRYGPYLDRDGVRANVPDELPPDELTAAMVEELFARPSGDHPLGTDPETGRAVVAKDGRYGPYVTEVLGEDEPTTGKNAVKPRTASLFKTMSLDTVTLEDALRLLTLPRSVGADADGHDITALNGRYGPYLSKNGETRSLESEEQLFSVTVDEALALFAAPKQRRGQARAAASVLKELGNDPVSGKPVTLREGRFGPYVTDGEVNASLRRDDDAETISPERAAELLSDKRAKGPAPRKRAVKKAPAKKTAKKTPAKKTPAKKTPAKKTPATKTAAKAPAPGA
jgi:DNA topoisomerase-1